MDNLSSILATAVSAVSLCTTAMVMLAFVFRRFRDNSLRKYRLEELERRFYELEKRLPCHDHDRRLSLLEGRGPRRR